MKLEKQLMLQIKQRLELHEMTGEVLWYGRLNSLEVKTIYGGRIKGLPKGTPDWLVLIRNRQEGIMALFIEAKSDTGQVRPVQTEFINKYGTKEGVFVMILRDIKDLDKFIEKYAKDFVENITL